MRRMTTKALPIDRSIGQGGLRRALRADPPLSQGGRSDGDSGAEGQAAGARKKRIIWAEASGPLTSV